MLAVGSTRAARVAALKRALAREPEESPWERDVAAMACIAAARMRARADGGGNGGDERARALRREAQTRLRMQRAALEAERIGGRSAARIAIVGAGPAGLWLAVLLARKHATLTIGANGAPRIVRNAAAPTIDVFERRHRAPRDAHEGGGGVGCGDDGGGGGGGGIGGIGGGGGGGGGARAPHGARSITLAIAHGTQDLLNRHLVGEGTLHAHHAFSPTCQIAEIERLLVCEFERYCAAGFGQLHFGADVVDPDVLHREAQLRGVREPTAPYDLVFVASGRRGTPDEWRVPRGLDAIVDGTAAAVIVQYWGARRGSERSIDALIGSVSRALAPARVFLRPGAVAGSGWAWLVGLPEALTEAARRGQALAKEGRRGGEGESAESLAVALEAILALARADPNADPNAGADTGAGAARSGAAESACAWPRMTPSALPGEAAALEGLRTLDASLRVSSARAGVTEASFWRSSSVLYAADGASGPTVLVGDAACGRPFWLGSTLNGHVSARTPPARAHCPCACALPCSD